MAIFKDRTEAATEEGKKLSSLAPLYSLTQKGASAHVISRIEDIYI